MLDSRPRISDSYFSLRLDFPLLCIRSKDFILSSVSMDKPMSNPPCLADTFQQLGFLQWGSRKRMRCYDVQVRSHGNTYWYREKNSINRVDRHLVRAEKETTTLPFEDQHHRHNQVKSKESLLIPSEQKLRRNQVKINSVFKSADRKSSILCKDNTTNKKKNFGSYPEKSIRLHPSSNGVCTRRSNIDGTNKISADGATMRGKVTDLDTFVWPKIHLTLSHSQKEEDFKAIKGVKLPLRPKKPSKLVQKAIQAVTPGSWLADLCSDRYQIKENKSIKKRSKGLRAMENVDTDLE